MSLGERRLSLNIFKQTTLFSLSNKRYVLHLTIGIYQDTFVHMGKIQDSILGKKKIFEYQ